MARFQREQGKRYFFRVKGPAKATAAFHCVALHCGLEHFSSQGSICFPADGADADSVIEAARAALGRARAEGRGTVETSEA